MRRMGILGVLLLTAVSAAQAETLQQIISRENVLLNCAQSSLTVGRDGMVYVCTGGNNSFVLRLTRDGKDKFGGGIVYAAHNATANADGLIASANAHFAHKVTIYDRTLAQTHEQKDFLVSDAVGWDAPGHVEAGASGDFYGGGPTPRPHPAHQPDRQARLRLRRSAPAGGPAGTRRGLPCLREDRDVLSYGPAPA